MSSNGLRTIHLIPVRKTIAIPIIVLTVNTYLYFWIYDGFSDSPRGVNPRFLWCWTTKINDGIIGIISVLWGRCCRWASRHIGERRTCRNWSWTRIEVFVDRRSPMFNACNMVLTRESIEKQSRMIKCKQWGHGNSQGTHKVPGTEPELTRLSLETASPPYTWLWEALIIISLRRIPFVFLFSSPFTSLISPFTSLVIPFPFPPTVFPFQIFLAIGVSSMSSSTSSSLCLGEWYSLNIFYTS